MNNFGPNLRGVYEQIPPTERQDRLQSDKLSGTAQQLRDRYLTLVFATLVGLITVNGCNTFTDVSNEEYQGVDPQQDGGTTEDTAQLPDVVLIRPDTSAMDTEADSNNEERDAADAAEDATILDAEPDTPEDTEQDAEVDAADADEDTLDTGNDAADAAHDAVEDTAEDTDLDDADLGTFDTDSEPRCEDNPSFGELCSEGIGECAREGAYACPEGALEPVCDAIEGDPTEEICDGLDNDCDGQIDESTGEVPTTLGTIMPQENFVCNGTQDLDSETCVVAPIADGECNSPDGFDYTGVNILYTVVDTNADGRADTAYVKLDSLLPTGDDVCHPFTVLSLDVQDRVIGTVGRFALSGGPNECVSYRITGHLASTRSALGRLGNNAFSTDQVLFIFQ